MVMDGNLTLHSSLNDTLQFWRGDDDKFSSSQVIVNSFGVLEMQFARRFSSSSVEGRQTWNFLKSDGGYVGISRAFSRFLCELRGKSEKKVSNFELIIYFSSSVWQFFSIFLSIFCSVSLMPEGDSKCSFLPFYLLSSVEFNTQTVDISNFPKDIFRLVKSIDFNFFFSVKISIVKVHWMALDNVRITRPKISISMSRR